MFGDVITKTHDLQPIDINNNPFYYLNKNKDNQNDDNQKKNENKDNQTEYDFEKDFEFKELIIESI